MLAAYAKSFDPNDPLSGLIVGDRPEPEVPDGWVTVDVKAASLNHHDLWSLRGVGLREEQLPMILGCDAVGVDADGNDVVVYPVVSDADNGGGDSTMDPNRSLLSEKYQGSLAERVAVPAGNLVPLPHGWSRAEASCLPTAWLTAYRMLAVRSGLQPGNTVLVQGAGGGVATACIALGSAMGFRVWVTSRDAHKREQARAIGAHETFEAGARLPERVDAVMETVGAATWEHSVKVLRPGGTIVTSGATSGPNPPASLTRIFFLQLSVVGSTMGTLQELRNLVSFCDLTGVRPIVDREIPLANAREAFEVLAEGNIFGKVVLTND